MPRKSAFCVAVFLFASIPAVAQSHSESAIAQYVKQAAEFSSRARANVYFPNVQSIFNGVQFSFVNVGTGNLTFTRRDVVASGRIPIVVARVYDSAGSGSPDFGPGWRLSAGETISVADNKARLITENGSTIGFVTTDGKNFQLERDFPSDYSSLIKTAPDTFQASLRTGFQMEFQLIGDQFRLTKVTDRSGSELRLIYESSALARIENANHWISLTRNQSGRIVLAQDDQQRKVSYAYDARGRLIEADDLGGHAWKYQYTDENRLAAAIDPLQRSNFAVTFGDSGRVNRLELPSGTIQYSYDPENNLTTVIDRKKLISRFYQNGEGITTRVVNALGEETAIALDGARNVISLSRNGSVVEAMQYDSQHHIISRQSSGDSGTVERQYSYDSATGLLAAIHTSNSDDQTFSYDARGNLTTASLPDGVHSFSFSSTGDLSSFSDQGSKFTFTSDPDGLVASMTDEKMARASFQHKAGAQLAAATIPGWSGATYEYQRSGLRSKMTYKNGSRVEYSYDPAGNLTATKVFDRKGKQINGQTLEMDSSYRLVRWVLFDKTETTFRYDPNGNLTEIKKNKSITRFEYDALDRLTAVITPDHQRLTYSYKPGERSLIEQYEHATVHVADLRDTGLTFGNSFNSVTSRPLTAPFGSMRFSETLGAFQLANADGSEIVRPQEAVETALAKLYLFQAGMPQKALRSGFGAPFNAMFIPAEYLTINCCPECYFDGSEWYCPPCSGGPPLPNPSLTGIDPPQVPLGTTSVTVKLSGAFNTNPSVSVSPSGISAGTATPNPDGTLSVPFTIQSSATVQNYTVTESDDGGAASINFGLAPAMTVNGSNDVNAIFVGTDPGVVNANGFIAQVNPTGGTFTATSNDTGDTFSQGTIGGLPKTNVTTHDQSSATGDRTLTFKYTVNSVTATQVLSVTARKFAFATNDPPSNTCSLGNGFDDTIEYTPFTHPDSTAVPPGIGLSGTVVSESFQNANNPTPCTFSIGPGNLDVNSQFSDRIAQCSSKPIATCSTTTTQSISVAGFPVRSNKLVITNTNLTYTNLGPTQ